MKMNGNGWVRTELSKISEASENSDDNKEGTHNIIIIIIGWWEDERWSQLSGINR